MTFEQFQATANMLQTADSRMLNDWYESTVGYRPQVDDPSMTDDDLRALCLEYLQEAQQQEGNTMPKQEKLIFVRGRWEIASVEANAVNSKPQWVRRDTSYICDVGQERGLMDMPAKPRGDSPVPSTRRPLGEILGATENIGSTTRDEPAPFLPPPFTK